MQPKIKVSKLMPDVFLHSRNALPKEKEKKQMQKQAAQKKKNTNEQKNNIDKQGADKKDQKNKRKNKNPFFNVRQYLKLSNQMVQRMKQVREELDKQKFSQLSFQNNIGVGHAKQQIEVKDTKIMFQDCITLNELKKRTQSSTLKKILHVPTLTVYYLRQSLIDFSIDKNDLQEWIKKSNTQTDPSSIRPQKIIQLFWNIPQTYYSILYEYVDGVIFDVILQNTSIFPLQFIQNMALTHLKADFQIFNSILIIKRNPQSQIRYLPVYQEVDDIIPQYRTFKDLLKINRYQQNQNVNKIQKIMVARLGFLVLITFFSDAIIDEDLNNILFESKDCCLFHKQMSNNQSIMKIYFQNNFIFGSEKQIISDFFCKMLKFKPQQRANFSQLSKHKFFRTKFTGQICKMHQIINMLESTGASSSSKNPSRELSFHKLNKIFSKMSVILQGSSQKQKRQINISLSNQNIKYILTDIGFTLNDIQTKLNMNEILGKFKKVYDI